MSTIFLSLLVLAHLAVLAYGQCPAGFTPSPTTKSCYKLNPAKLTWEAASAACKATACVGLAQPYRQAANDDLINFITTTLGANAATECPIGIWIDGLKVNGEYQWTDQPQGVFNFAFAGWAPGQPDNTNGKENCNSILTLTDAANHNKWNDYPCDATLCSICEY